jgi:hypothetical protein
LVAWTSALAVGRDADLFAPPRVTLHEALPAPNYPLTTDGADLVQLTDGELSAYPTWTRKSSVGWVNRTPVVLTGKVTGASRPGQVMVARLRVASGEAAGVRAPRRIDVYCSAGAGRWSHAGDAQGAGQAVENTAAWIEIPLRADCGGELAFVLHADGPYLMLDEVSIRVAGSVERPRPETSLPVQTTIVPSDGVSSDSTERLRAALLSTADEPSSAPPTAGREGESACLMDAWAHLGSGSSDSCDGASLVVAAVPGTDASWLIRLTNDSNAEARYTVKGPGGGAPGFRAEMLLPVLAADGRVVHDAIVPLPAEGVAVPARSRRYITATAAPSGPDARLQFSVASDGGYRRSFVVTIEPLRFDELRVRASDVVVWGYRSDAPISTPANARELIRDQVRAGVSVFVVHPSDVPRPVGDGSGQAREGRLRESLELLRDAGQVLLYLGWDSEFGSADDIRRHADQIGEWLRRLREVMRQAGRTPAQWALYPYDEPDAPEFASLAVLADIVASVSPDVRIYANPGRLTVADLMPGGAAWAVRDSVAIWQPQAGSALDSIVAAQLWFRPRELWVYYVPPAPAKADDPRCYRTFIWEAARANAVGVGVWSYSDTAGSSAWDDLDGTRPDWAMVYEAENGAVPSRRWRAFLQGAAEMPYAAACMASAGSGRPPRPACVSLLAKIEREAKGVDCYRVRN